MRLLIFGSSQRRGAPGWTNPLPIRALLAATRPDAVAHGESPSGGADALADIEARRYYEALGLDPYEHVLPFPMVPALDGDHRGRFMVRNGRMEKTFRPTHAAGFVSGRVGQKVGRIYLTNGSQDMADRLRLARVPLVIYRDDGIDLPGGDALGNALALLRLLYRSTPEVAAAGAAVRVAIDAQAAGASPEDVAVLVAGARGEVEMVMGEQARAAPWLAVAVGLLRS